MLNKAGTAYVTADGKIVPPPPGARPVRRQPRPQPTAPPGL
jgi:hypothetical protein